MKAFKHFAMKTVAFLLVMSMLVAAGVGLVSVSAETVSVSPTSSSAIEIKAGTNDGIAMRIKVNSDFTSYGPKLASYGVADAKVKIALYKWDSNYDKTVRSTPLHSAVVTIRDNATHTQELQSAATAGEYLIEVSEATTSYTKQLVAWYGNVSDTANSGCYLYRRGTLIMKDGAPTGEMSVSFGFTSSPASNFSPVSGHPVSVAIEEEPSDNTSNTLTAHYYRLAPTNDVVAQRLNITTSFVGFKMNFPNWGNAGSGVSLTAYKWQGTYDATIKSQALVTKSFTGINDHQGCSVYFDSPMPAGQYLFAARSLNPDAPTAIYYVTSNTGSKGYSYIDGAEMKNDLRMSIYFDGSAPATPFAECTGYDDTSTGTAPLPQKWQPEADSLLNTHKVQPDAWVFTDGLGRESLQYGDTGVNATNDKTLAMFYWNWHLAHNKSKGTQVINIQKFIEQYPEAKNDYNHSAWPAANTGYSYSWNEPLYGYYSTDDEWVLRRHAELLANAKIDTVFTDNSNGVVPWEDGYDFLFQAWTDAQNDGVNTPKISFWLPMYTTNEGNDGFKMWTVEQLEYLYMDIFQRGKYESLWFWFDGKPMMVAHGDQLDSSNNLHKEIASFFTLREGVGSYHNKYDGYVHNTNESRIGQWGWLSVYPQVTYFKNKSTAASGKVEQMSVGVAQNYNYMIKDMTAMNGYYITGRSYTSDKSYVLTNTPTSFQTSSENSKWGYNIGEQYNYALEVNPDVVYVTGWNEWTVTRATSWKSVPNAFADIFNDEYSRDIEPTKGALKDYYYYQLVNFSRQYQGATPMPRPNAEKSIDLTSSLASQWANVEPYFGAYIGNTMDRSEYGHVTSEYYTDFSGRNDIIGAQVSRDDNYLYFNVECNANITAYTDNLWMNLYIDVDQTNKGWETFDFVVNKTKPTATTAVLERFTGNGFDSEFVANVEYAVDGKYMTVKIPKSALGITDTDYTVNFSWTDNVHDAKDTGAKKANGEYVYTDFSGDIMDFYTSGDVAPGARFKYSYIVDDDYKLYEGSEVGNQAVETSANNYGQKFSVNAGQQVESLSVTFSAPDDMDGDTIGTGEATMKIYQWKGTYASTVAAAPLYTSEFTGSNMAVSTFTIPEDLCLEGELYWEITPKKTTGNLVPLGATHKAENVVNFINGVEGAACTGWTNAHTMRASVKMKNIEKTYIYYNSINKEVLYTGNVEYAFLDSATKTLIAEQANKFADANGFREFTGFELKYSEDNVYVYYSTHTYVDTIQVNGVDTALDGNHVVVEADATNANGDKFYGWADKYGNILSNYRTFKFYPRNASDSIVAVYGVEGDLVMDVHAYVDRTNGQFTVTVTPVRSKSDTIVEFGYFVGVGKTFESYGTVEGGALASISGASKVVAKDAAAAYLQRTYNLSYESFDEDIAVLAYVTYTDVQGNTYTRYADAVKSEHVIGDSDIEITPPDASDGGWL